MIFLLRLVVSLGSLCLTQAACTKDGCPFSAVSGFIGPDYKYTRCGQVDAAPRMPNDIWKDPHAVEKYVNFTLELYSLPFGARGMFQSDGNLPWRAHVSSTSCWSIPCGS